MLNLNELQRENFMAFNIKNQLIDNKIYGFFCLCLNLLINVWNFIAGLLLLLLFFFLSLSQCRFHNLEINLIRPQFSDKMSICFLFKFKNCNSVHVSGKYYVDSIFKERWMTFDIQDSTKIR